MITIEKGSTRAIIHIKTSDPYAALIRSIAKYHLTDFDWDPRLKRMIPTRHFIRYDSLMNKLYIPINALPYITEGLATVGEDVNIIEEKLVAPRKINIQMKPDFVPREAQINVINYLTDKKEHRKGLATETGSGKTVSSIASIVRLGQVSMILVSGLYSQWVRSILQFTTATMDDICVLQGSKSVMDLMASDRKPSFFVCSLETLRAYANRTEHYLDLPPYEKFIEYYGIGVKLMDEVHLNFHAETQIDLRSNIENNYYLTATFTSSSKITRKIFNTIYPPSMRYGEGTSDKYIAVTCYNYYGDVPEKACIKMRGYNHAKYENCLLKSESKFKRYFDYIIHPIFVSHYLNKRKEGEKSMIYFARIPMVEKMLEYFRRAYPDLKIDKAIGGSDEEVYNNNDVIITTPKKSGTGRDVGNLRFVLCTVSMKTPTLTQQLRGRLRKLKDGTTPEYAELCDLKISSQRFHKEEREVFHRDRAISYAQLLLP